MRILFSGASSFTGSWFASALASSGHHVTATFRGAADSYHGPRGTRVEALEGVVEPVWSTSFGDDRFADILASERFDLLCHHAAEMSDYRSWTFDTLAATTANTRNARLVLERLARKGGYGLVLTGSVFEPLEGIGDPQQRAFSPYGLSKHLSFEIFRMEAERLKLPLAKFVIPNPFGPREEFRFTSFLAREWLAGRTPRVATPLYVRDNIPVSLLTLAYVACVEQLQGQKTSMRAAPSGYVEDQGAFAQRVGRELAPRLRCACPVELATQVDFAEPLMRVNDERAAQTHVEWSETAAWDELADYYATTLRSP